ncbi:hypothetical protein ACFL5V_12445 [Fibrobacterota bacterium]
MNSKHVTWFALLALTLSVSMALRIHGQKKRFNTLEDSSHKIMDNYLERYLELADKLELAVKNRPDRKRGTK